METDVGHFFFLKAHGFAANIQPLLQYANSSQMRCFFRLQTKWLIRRGIKVSQSEILTQSLVLCHSKITLLNSSSLHIIMGPFFLTVQLILFLLLNKAGAAAVLETHPRGDSQACGMC